MTEPDTGADAVRAAAPTPLTAGALLRSAREASGMSVDSVAQQLKLAPRQVRAIEDDDFTHLPGRTFVRGFIRNYARLVRLDPDAVLAALPVGTATPNLESPALHATAPTISELPMTEPARHGWTRWAIPLTLFAIIAATAAWEWQHRSADISRLVAPKVAPPAAGREPARVPEVIGTPLPNPAAAPAPASDATAEKASTPETAATHGAPMDAGAPVAQTAAPGPAAADAPLVLTFRDYSWTEVKERSGRVLLSRMNAGGTTQALAAAPPLDVVIGNAADVTLTWRGQRVDLAPHTRQNVARLTLE